MKLDEEAEQIVASIECGMQLYNAMYERFHPSDLDEPKQRREDLKCLGLFVATCILNAVKDGADAARKVPYVRATLEMIYLLGRADEHDRIGDIHETYRDDDGKHHHCFYCQEDLK